MAASWLHCIAIITLTATAVPAFAQTLNTGADRVTWNLDSVYPTEAAWEGDRLRVLRDIGEMHVALRRDLNNAKELADLMDLLRRTRGLAGKMARFGLLSSNVDRSSEIARARYDGGTSLEAQVEAAALPLEAKIRALGEERVRSWQRSEKRLESFGHTRRLRRIFHEARHAAPLVAQPILASMERWPRTTADTYEALVADGISWPVIKNSRGEDVRLTPNNYRTARRDSGADVRAQAAKTFHSTLERFESVLGLLVTRRVEAELALAKPRGFDDPMAATLMLRDAVPSAAITAALKSAEDNKSVSRRYADLLARAYRVPRASYSHALARSPWPSTGTFTVPQAIDLIVESHVPLGKEHQQAVRALFAKPLFHLAPGPNKSGGWGVFIQVGGGDPYAFSTFTGDLDSIRLLSSMTQSMLLDVDIPADGWPDRREEDQPIFGNSRWNLGPFLLDDVLLERAREPQARAAALLNHINLLWTGYFQRAALIGLERWIAETVASGSPPTGSQISAKYLSLLRNLSGHDEDGLRIEEVYGREWVTEGTLFLGQHQMGFLASHAATVATAEALQRRDPVVLRNMRFVRGRNLEYSNDFLISMKIDLVTAQPFDAIARRMTRMMDELERELTMLGL